MLAVPEFLWLLVVGDCCAATQAAFVLAPLELADNEIGLHLQLRDAAVCSLIPFSTVSGRRNDLTPPPRMLLGITGPPEERRDVPLRGKSRIFVGKKGQEQMYLDSVSNSVRQCIFFNPGVSTIQEIPLPFQPKQIFINGLWKSILGKISVANPIPNFTVVFCYTILQKEIIHVPPKVQKQIKEISV